MLDGRLRRGGSSSFRCRTRINRDACGGSLAGLAGPCRGGGGRPGARRWRAPRARGHALHRLAAPRREAQTVARHVARLRLSAALFVFFCGYRW